ncbi:MAG: hypothetical protein M5R36_15625 [Deltaproteobacteria bacterium]|nr:hypothetical protein [Deltaproteobacteria bacterium]
MVDWLRDRYGDDVAAFNLVWDLGILSFDELLPMTSVSAVSFDADKKADRAAFAGFVAERFFKTCHDAIRAADPNHLILGARFISWVAPREVVRAIVPYTDVVSVNHYMVFPIYFGMMDWLADTLGWMHVHDMLQEYYDETNLPVLITEFSIRALDAGVPSTWPPNWFFHTVQTQAERADFFENYARQTFRTGFIVGYHWFSYMDEPPEGRFDGENSNFGLVDNNDNPWTELTERMTAVNADAYVWPLADDDDDTADDDTSDDDTAGDDDTSSDDDSIFDDDGDDDDSVTDDDSSFDDDDDDSEADDDTTPGDNLAAASGDDDDGGCCG